MTIGKHKRTHRIDKPAQYAGGAEITESTADFVPPAIKSIPPPENLVLDSFVGRSSAAPTTYITAVWDRPFGSNPQSYVIQISLSNTFPAATTATYTAVTESATLEGLKPNTLYYVRVAAVYRSIQSGWSDIVSETTPLDTTAAAQPTSLAGAWIGAGDLLLTWVNPIDDNFKDVEIRIYASNGGTLYRTIFSAAGRFLYTTAMNLTDTAGVGDPSLYVLARSRTFSNVTNNTAVPSLTTTKPAPTAPTLAHSWTGDTGAAGADLKFTWTAIADAAVYTLALNGGTAQRHGANVYTYTYAHNVADNGATGDPSITYSLRAIDGLGQQSTAVSGTATNAAPAAPTATLEQGAVSGVHATVTTSAPPADFWRHEFVFKRDGSTVATVFSTGATARYEMQGASDVGYHSWTVVIRQQDLFAQFSSTVTPAAVAFEGLTLAGLRAGALYSDNLGTAAATLKTALADNVTTSGGQAYPA
jgi:hypothetical protein